MERSGSDTFDAQYWRGRAAEARATADLVPDPIAKTMMVDIANKYDHMAERAAKQEQKR
jgi:O-methyltransferase involved in polyketide biosynthesis